MSRTAKLTVADLVFRFLAAQQIELAHSSYKWYAMYLEPFAKKYGRLIVPTKPAPTPTLNSNELSPAVVKKWIAGYPDASQHNAARTIVRACNWGVEKHLLVASPLRGFRKPSPTRRQFTLTQAEYVLCLKNANSLRDAVKFLWHTGCRPQEFRAIESRWISGSKIELPLAHSKGGKKRRTIYLDGMALGIATRNAKANRNGPIFRNAHGERWTKNSLGLAFQRLRYRTGITNLCAYSFRHAFITRMLERGVDAATVAAISGNSTEMVLEVYNHVGSNESRLLSIVQAG